MGSAIIGLNGQPLNPASVNMSSAVSNPYGNARDTYHSAGMGRMGELRNWNTTPQSADSALLPHQKTLNARTDDAVRNGGYAKGGVQLHVDMMVGHQWKLSYKPNYRVLGISAEESREFADQVQAQFTDYAEDPECYIDVERRRTLTMMAREVARTHCMTGEHFSKAEILKGNSRPYGTAIQMINGYRIDNPDFKSNNQFLRNGIRLDRYSAARGYWIKTAIAADSKIGDHRHKSVYVPRRLPWGRMQLLHLFEPGSPNATRGANGFLSVLSKMPMLNKFQDATLQNAIINALYAAVIKSNVDGDTIKDVLNGNSKGAQQYMMEKAAWHDEADIRLDGMKIPHLFLNEELELLSSQSPGSEAGDFESGILRELSAGLNLSYEQFSHDFSKSNLSSARAGMSQSMRSMLGGREMIVKRFSNYVFALWLEEAIATNQVKLPGNKNFYEAKSAWCRSDWIGAGKISIDGLKEVKESVALLEAGLSTYEIECAKFGTEYREILDQQIREQAEQAKHGMQPLWLARIKAETPETPEQPGVDTYKTDENQ